MDFLDRIDAAVEKHIYVKLIVLAFILLVVLPLWFLAALVEQSIMWLKGYSPDSGYGGYRHRKTGHRIPSGW